MNENSISKLLAKIKESEKINDVFFDLYMFNDERLMGYSFGLIKEIDEFLAQGYTKDEILNIINECDFCTNDPQLTKEEGEYLRDYSIRMLDIRYKLYNKEKNTTKTLEKSINKNDK